MDVKMYLLKSNKGKEKTKIKEGPINELDNYYITNYNDEDSLLKKLETETGRDLVGYRVIYTKSNKGKLSIYKVLYNKDKKHLLEYFFNKLILNKEDMYDFAKTFTLLFDEVVLNRLISAITKNQHKEYMRNVRTIINTIKKDEFNDKIRYIYQYYKNDIKTYINNENDNFKKLIK